MRSNTFEEDFKLSGLCGLYDENVLVDFNDDSFDMEEYISEK